MTELPPIPEFYAGKEIFITGGTGFLGKAVIEKILRSCPGVSKLYVLIRKKRGQSVEERLNQIKSNPLFNLLLQTNCNAFDKIVPIEGDVQLRGLGMSDVDKQKLQNVSIIIHASACVRFDDPIKEAIFTNVRSTRDLLDMALNMKNLVVFVHVSTTYCNADYKNIEEKIYPPHADWRKSIEIAESLDSDQLDILTKKYTDFLPNTYVFTKGLAEELCNDYRDRVPLVIYRPAIISGGEREPIPGWSDNFNNINGLGLAGGLGLIQHMYSREETRFHLIPVDTCVKGLLIAAYKKAVTDDAKNSEITVYNCTNGATSTRELIWLTMTTANKNHIYFKDAVWCRRMIFVKTALLDFLLTILLYVIPGLLIDFITVHVLKKPPQLLKIHRKIKSAKMALSYYMMNVWTIQNHNYMSLDFFIRKEDRDEFSIRSKATIDRLQYTYDQTMYITENILKEGNKNNAESRRRYMWFTIADHIIVTLLWFLSAHMIFKYFLDPYFKFS